MADEFAYRRGESNEEAPEQSEDTPRFSESSLLGGVAPFTGGFAPAPLAPNTTRIDPNSGEFGYRGSSDEPTVQQLASANRLSYVPVPELRPEMVAQQVFNSFVRGENINPYAAADIQRRVREMAALPELTMSLRGPQFLRGVEWLDQRLQEPGSGADFEENWDIYQENMNILNQFADTYWTGAVDAMNSTLKMDSQVAASRGKLETHHLTARFFAKHGEDLSPDERDLFLNILGTYPDPAQMVSEAGVYVPRHDGSRWHNFLEDLAATSSIITKAPDALRPSIQDPRTNMLVQAELYLRNKPLSEPQNKVDFFNWVMSQGHQSIAEVAARQAPGTTDGGQFEQRSGIPGAWDAVKGTFGKILGSEKMAVAGAALDFIPSSFHNAAADLFANAAGTDAKYVSQLTVGQQMTLNLGYDPSDNKWQTISGTADAIVTIWADPQNLFFGMGAAIKNARQIPRAAGMTRRAMLKTALNPFSGANMGMRPIPTLDRSLTGRLAYAAFSKTVDDIVELPRNNRTWQWLANTTSKSEILDRFPSFDNSTHMVDFLVEAKTVDEVKELMKMGLAGDELFIESVPAAMERVIAESAAARKAYVRTLQQAGQNGALSVADLTVGDAVLDVLEASRYTPDEAAKVRRIADASSPEDIQQGGAIKDFDVGMVLEDFKTQNKILTGEMDAADTIFDGWQLSKKDVGTVKVGDSSYQVQKITSMDGAIENVTYGIFQDGELIGGITGAAGKTLDNELGVMHGIRNPEMHRGVMGRVWEMARKEGDDFILQSGQSNSLSEAGFAFAKNQAKRLVDEMDSIQYRKSVPGGGTGQERLVITSHATDYVRTSPDDTDFLRALRGMDEDGLVAAAKLITGSQLDATDLKAIEKTLNATGKDILDLGDSVVLGRRARKTAIPALDGAVEDAMPTSQRFGDEFFDMGVKRLAVDDFNSRRAGELYIIKDLPHNKFSYNLYRMGDRVTRISPRGWARRARQAGAAAKYQVPTNIDMSKPHQGSRELRRWIKFLGGSDELAAKWGDAFLDSDPVGRRQIINQAMEELGSEMNAPALKYRLYDLSDKQNLMLYETGRSGDNIGEGPLTIANTADMYVMPNPQELRKTINRGFHKKWRYSDAFTLSGTKKSRRKLVDDLKLRARRGGYDLDELTDEDWARAAYADYFGGAYGRGNGAGVVAKTANLGWRGVRAVGSVFTVAQLAGRPIAWASRVLMEEMVRADLMGMPSVYANPFEYMKYYMDAKAIRELPKDLEVVGDAASEIVSSLYRSGSLDVAAAAKLFPEVAVTPGISRAALADLVGREFRAGRVPRPGAIGARRNITRRAWSAGNRIQANKRRIARYQSLDESFRWQIDGAEIANRTFYADYMKEANASVQAVEWHPTRMTAEGVETYGRAYGREMNKMFGDPIVGVFGVNRMVDRLQGLEGTKWNADALLRNRNWDRVQPLIKKQLGDQYDLMEPREIAEWYLDNVVDEISETLFRPMVQGKELDDAAQMLKDLRGGKQVELTVGDQTIALRRGRENYEDIVTGMTDFVKAVQLDETATFPMPARINSYFDPRFGQREKINIVGRASDWMLQKFGEQASQNLNRQAAYLASRERYFNYYKNLGWDAETARIAAAEKAATLTNYVFFDNSSISSFLHEANRVMPFFSAMFEVGQTWAYKVPMMNLYGLGIAQLGRRVDRTLQGLVKGGIADYDTETGQFSITVTEDDDGISGGLYDFMRLPVTTMEAIAGLGHLMKTGQYESADFSEWAKGGFTFNIGNPLDPSSTGLGAVNQFSIGLTPAAQYLASGAAKRIYAWDDQVVETDGETVAEYIEGTDMLPGDLLYYNREAFIEKNGREKYNQALAREIDVTELAMPDKIRVPKSSWWETMLDNTIFPFGRMDGYGEIFGSVVPSAMQHVIRGWGIQQWGEGSGNDALAFLFGNMSKYQVGAELLNAAQYLEINEGLLTKERALSEKVAAARAAGEDTTELNEELENLNAHIARRVESIAAGSSFTRGVIGNLGPVTPRMHQLENEVAADYWATRDYVGAVEEANPTMAGLIQQQGINNINDFARATELVGAWLNDSSGDDARTILVEENPALVALTQGKSYYGEIGFHPETGGFDQWVEEIESGERQAVPLDVFIQRYNRAAISADKQLAIIQRYGNDPDKAMQAILYNYYDYEQNIVEEYDMKYEALKWMDVHLYDSALTNYDADAPSVLTQYQQASDELRDIQQDLDSLDSLLQEANLTPAEERRLSGALSAGVARLREKTEELRSVAEGDATYLNPLEQKIAKYWQEINGKYYDARADIYENQIANADNQDERSLGYEALRTLDNNTYWERHEIDGTVVPDPLTRSWNGKSPEDREELLIRNIGKPGNWLNAFEVDVIREAAPLAADYLPTAETMRLYDSATLEKLEIDRMARENPDRWTPYERDQAKADVDKRLESNLRRAGRAKEIQYNEAVPITKMQLLGLLPSSLDEVANMTNRIVRTLAAQDKSPLTNDGREKFLQLVEYLEREVYPTNKQVRQDLRTLGVLMFDTADMDVIYARLLQGANPMTPRLK